MLAVFAQGGPVIWPLLLCSLVAVTVIIERFWFWLRIDRDYDARHLNDVLCRGREDDWGAALEMAGARRDYCSRVLAAGIAHRHGSATKFMEAAAAEEVIRMRRFMPALDTIVTAAPLMGILGTVIGIIVSFDLLGARGIDDPLAVTAGIAQALISTAAGLTVAIFTVFPYNYFNARKTRAMSRMQTWSTRLEALLPPPAFPATGQQENPHEIRLAN